MTVEQVKDAYRWHVIYTDETYIDEYDHAPGRGWGDVGDKPVRSVWLMRHDPNRADGHHVDVPGGAVPVFFRRRSIEINLLKEQEQRRRTVHCIGWTRADTAVYLFVFEDGSTLLSDNLQAV